MNYWLINGIGIEAVRLPTALHKYGQWMEKNQLKGDLPRLSESGKIDWRRISSIQYRACSHKW